MEDAQLASDDRTNAFDQLAGRLVRGVLSPFPEPVVDKSYYRM